MASQGDQSKTGSQYADSARWQATRSNENRRDGYHWSTLAKPSGMHCLGNCMAMVSILNADDETLAREAVGKASNDSTASEHPMLLQGCVVSCHMQPLNKVFSLSLTDNQPATLGATMLPRTQSGCKIHPGTTTTYSAAVKSAQSEFFNIRSCETPNRAHATKATLFSLFPALLVLRAVHTYRVAICRQVLENTTCHCVWHVNSIA